MNATSEEIIELREATEMLNKKVICLAFLCNNVLMADLPDEVKTRASQIREQYKGTHLDEVLSSVHCAVGEFLLS